MNFLFNLIKIKLSKILTIANIFDDENEVEGTTNLSLSSDRAVVPIVDIETIIQKFKATDIDLMKQNAKKSNVSFEELKILAAHLGMPKIYGKV